MLYFFNVLTCAINDKFLNNQGAGSISIINLFNLLKHFLTQGTVSNCVKKFGTVYFLC